MKAKSLRIKWHNTEQLPPDDGIEVLGYNPDWVDEDFNPDGVRVCFVNEGQWTSAKWDNCHDAYFPVFANAPLLWTPKPSPTNNDLEKGNEAQTLD